MFDDVKKDSPQNQNSNLNTPNLQNPPQGGESNQSLTNSLEQPSPVPQNQGGKVEDIFADVDTGEKPKEKPAQFQPKTEATPPPPPTEETQVKKTNKTKKMIFILLIVIVVLLVVAGGVYGYLYFSSRTGGEGGEETGELINSENEMTEEEVVEEEVVEEEEENIIEEEIVEEEEEVIEEEIKKPKDTDQDGLTDDEERSLGTNINDIDTDGDGLFDMEEVKTYKTDPLEKDTDGDGYLDGAEVDNGYDPNGPGKLIKDSQIPILTPRDKFNQNIF